MSTTDGPRVPDRTGKTAFFPVAVSMSSSFVSDMPEEPCKKRGVRFTMDLRQPYMARSDQGNGRAKTGAVAGHSMTLNSSPGFGFLFGYMALISSRVSSLNLASGMSAA